MLDTCLSTPSRDSLTTWRKETLTSPEPDGVELAFSLQPRVERKPALPPKAPRPFSGR